jgi:hypothetical protein
MPSYKTPQVNFVCKKEQYAEIERRAKQYGMSIAEYCRFCALNAEIKVIVGGKGDGKDM